MVSRKNSKTSLLLQLGHPETPRVKCKQLPHALFLILLHRQNTNFDNHFEQKQQGERG